ncbi:Hypothetical_protein [Hexamita inflata]|uniref:Hypothetical_protein n=1 Tax=Hexamita inflata TaxID=28002 RepID=A0AA86NPQ1_9EUKA|nr:Hypothetical protein HINF_LOCUS10626 [Hexamita inflata]
MFRKTIYADNIYQNSDVCKFLEQCSLDFVMTFRKIREMAEVQKIVGIFETNEFSKSEFPLFTVLQIQAKKDELAQIDYSHGRQKLAKLKEITKSLLFLQKMVLIMSSNILQQITKHFNIILAFHICVTIGSLINSLKVFIDTFYALTLFSNYRPRNTT